MRIIISIILLTCALIHNPVYALGKVSRACHLLELPGDNLITRQVMTVLERIGSAPIGSLQALLTLPPEKKAEYVALESITLDSSRNYYLFAEANITRRVTNLVSGMDYAPDKWKYSSPGFELLSFPQELEAYLLTAGSTFVHNRGKYFSARAGHPNIFAYVPRPYYASWSPWWISDGVSFEVVGRHYYHDPSIARTYNMGYSRAKRCNLREWGDPEAIGQTIIYSILDR